MMNQNHLENMKWVTVFKDGDREVREVFVDGESVDKFEGWTSGARTGPFFWTDRSAAQKWATR